ncbi:lysophospholipid acyltransferase family protein [Pseudomonas sp. GCM10022188]|uniref:lysophospholipid acyltransferase family protein n=1 Tax=Pseudomonas TaxID=286 RepID=UPI001E3E553A|nr:lysophospholipid acyltransferase family protein [Pseudomonas oryzagri]MCC6074535.1 1-acyl-sn-glycerol-3-phosphate acyltransferase [Pseudomonas oryzagri]
MSLRTALFYLLLGISTVIWCLLSLLIAPWLPQKARYIFIARTWCRFAVWLSRAMLGIDYRLEGLQNIPEQPCVILAKHQSAWETFFLTAHFAPLTQVLKQELLRIPFYGWAFKLLKPIGIDRDNPKQALKQVASVGLERLQQGNWLLIFPEGTRIPAGEMGKFSRSGSSVAVAAGVPVLPVAHNAGELWPRDGWQRHPGTITVVFGPALHAEGEGPRAVAELNQRAETWIGETMQQINGTARAKQAD